jgi:hypothetical protein
MAGGMGGRGGIPMSRRVRLSSTSAGLPGVPDECPARHCWVAGAVDDAGTKRPGLLVEWRSGADGWEGRVVYAALLRPGGWLLVEEWLPSSLLSPR